jgi:hypothetical protein
MRKLLFFVLGLMLISSLVYSADTTITAGVGIDIGNAGGVLTIKGSTAAVTNGDTTHIPTCDDVYDFTETIQDYLKSSEIAGNSTQWNTMPLSSATIVTNDLIRWDGGNWVRIASGTVAGSYLKQDFTWATPSGSGDIVDVGDCASGAAFTADGTGNTLYFEGSSADGVETILTAEDPTTADKTITLPNATGYAVIDNNKCTDLEGTNLSIAGGTLNATDTNTQLSDEEVQDKAGAMWTGNTEIRATVTYQDADGTIDIVVPDMNDDVPEAGDFTNLTGGDLITHSPTGTLGVSSATVTNGDTTHVPTCDNVYDFCETTQGYYNSGDAVTFATVDTGEGANELFGMNQDVMTTDDVAFIKVSQSSAAISAECAIPNTAGDVTCDANGEIAVDTTNKQLVVYDGKERAIPLRHIGQGCWDLASWWDVDHEVWLIDLHADVYPNGITITGVHLDCNVADPTTEFTGDLKYCDAVGGAAFPGANATVITAMDSTTGNFTVSLSSAVATGKTVYMAIDADPTDANTLWHLRFHFDIEED